MASIPPKREDDRTQASLRTKIFSLRIVHLEYYMTTPLSGMDDCYSHFQGCSVREVPVVRIFGSTTSAQKTCLHLHKAFPYFYVSYDDELPQEVNEALAYVRQLASAVEKALKVASTVGAKRQHVHSCSLVRGTKYYGYHPSEQLFVKLVLYYPQEVSRTSTLLLSGGIMNHKFQPYEAHIPYLLQILIDYNLYGMGHVHLSSLKFRYPLPNSLSNLTSLVKNVKSEYSCKRTSSDLGQDNLDTALLCITPKETDHEKTRAHSTLHLSPQQGTNEIPTSCPDSKSRSDGTHQSAESPASQPDAWIQGCVPESWMWPMLASSQGQGPHSRQSTCELEVDTSVEDILNRRELLFKPLQETGPEVKMVQSLISMWEEELLRSGEDGPAGPVNDQYQPTARSVPSASTLEQAMREALFEIANSEEHQIQSPNEVQECTLSTDMVDPGLELTMSLENLLQLTIVANGETSPTSVALPAFTQNYQIQCGTPSQSLDPDKVTDRHEMVEQADVGGYKDKSPVDEEAIKSHLSQRLKSQEEDYEVVEFLKWMDATQHDEDRKEDEQGDEMALTQIFSSPGMDSALLKALAEYETATERECQEILDCVHIHDEEVLKQDIACVDDGSKIKGDNEWNTWLEASTNNMSPPLGSHLVKVQNESRTSVRFPQTEGPCDDDDFEDESNDNERLSKKFRGDRPFVISQQKLEASNSGLCLPRGSHLKLQNGSKTSVHIPQTDGTYDDEDEEDELNHNERPSKKCRGNSPVGTSQQEHLYGKSGENSHRFPSQGSREPSLREQMRRQRERRPRKKSSSSLSEDSMDMVDRANVKQNDVKTSNSDDLIRTSRKTSAKGAFDRHSREVNSREFTSSEGLVMDKTPSFIPVSEKIGKGRSKPDDKGLVKNFKYAPLPIMKVKIESVPSVSHKDLPEGYEQGSSSAEKPLRTPKACRFDKEISPSLSLSRMDQKCFTTMENFSFRMGDDRDCGGGLGTYQKPSNIVFSNNSPVRNPESKETRELKTEDEPAQDVRELRRVFENCEPGRKIQFNDGFLNDGQERDFANCELSRGSQFDEPQDLINSNDEFEMTKNDPFGTANDLSGARSLFQANENEEIIHFKEGKGEMEVSPLSRSPGSESDREGIGFVPYGVLPSTQYLFTDMSDCSNDSSVSAKGESDKEHNWNAAEAFLEEDSFDSSKGDRAEDQKWNPAEAFIEDHEMEKVQNLIAQEQERHSKTCEYGSSFEHIEAKTDMGSRFEGQTQDFTSKVHKGHQDQKSPLSNFGSSVRAPSSVSPSPVCPSLFHRSLRGPVMPRDMVSPNAEYSLEVVPKVSVEPSKALNLHSLTAQASEDLSKHDEASKTIPLVFHQRPPAKEHLLSSYREISSSFHEEGAVFYGNVKDVSDRPTIMAGLIFDVKSKEAAHLKAFSFGGSCKRSNFEAGARTRQYIGQETWGAQQELDCVIGVPSHFENDGSVSYIISPALAPPAPRDVKQWVASMQSVVLAENAKGTGSDRNQMFTMDTNTGKLVPLADMGDLNSQESSGQTQNTPDDLVSERPASPKYSETHVLNLTNSSPRPSTSKPRESKADFVRSEGLLSKISSAVSPNQSYVKAFSKPPLIPCSAQASHQRALTVANVSKDEEVKVSARNEVLGKIVPENEQKKPIAGKLNIKSPRQWRDVSQMTAITPATHSTPLSQAGFRDPASVGGGQQITLMSIEVFASTRDEFLPDPRYDAIGCIVLVVQEDWGSTSDLTIVLIRDTDAHNCDRYLDGVTDCEIIYLVDEIGLLNCFIRLVNQCDPDILLGWEVQGYSLGLLAERAANLGIGLLKQLSRIPPVSTTTSEGAEKDPSLEDIADLFDKLPLETKTGDQPIIEDEWGRTQGSGLHVGGRIVLNLWRIMRGEVKLAIYTLEAVAESVLRRRVPRVPWETLTRWFSLGPGGGRFRCLEYFINRARLNLQIIEQLDLMNRTSELARIFGIDFYSVFSRGSQFRVESMMARLAHTQNYLLVSPTRQQVADQPAMECLPLVMEPESRFYTSPVIVLDFQSLYPSMIIAYNLCFSTCLGKLVPGNPKVLGVSKLSMQPGLLESLKERMTITPNGVMFTPSEVRPGVLPRLLQEILTTRIMVKKAMKKLSPDQRVLQRVLNARQFALKLIANVTYGYTAAGFSGRMPCAEIADSIVQCGRLTLERAIKLVNSHPRWGARVVYGDTDSMFVLMEGRTREEAHAIGQEIAAAVTETNPPPVALKMEKVYHPCVLLTKKRYVGYSYESASQAKPIFDAKGIETIRRDSCPAVAKALEHSLKILFESQDLSKVKQYLQRQWGKILSGRISLQDFIFAKEVRLGTYSSRSPVLPPAAIVASKAMALDPRAEPRYGERVPYVVVHGEPGARLVDMVVDPLTLIDQPSLRLHDTYYITKQIIPACQRIFMLVGVDLKAWFGEMPRVYRPPVSKRVAALAIGARSTTWDPQAAAKKKTWGGAAGLKHGTIDQYYLSRHCTVCGELTRASQLLCGRCSHTEDDQPSIAPLLITARTARLEREFQHLKAICRHCGGDDGSLGGSIACLSLDCSAFFERSKVHRELQAAGAVARDLGYYPPCLSELF